ncbi:lumican isoform X1 [Scleropages formosus]|uniref:Lumican n=1 Tax=Scleropages formosus TaxID=113540 RepID=A0A8C9STM3_SCLFO|nr:lumican isoform X1 [Scleropages formosus]
MDGKQIFKVSFDPVTGRMGALRLCLLAALMGGALCQYYDYDAYYQPSSFMGPSGPNCAQECECPILFPSAMYCDGRKLKFIPIVPSGIKYLYLQNNMIEEIKAGVFDNATDLRWLVLDHNQITSSKVAKGTIDKLVHLEKLLFSYNNLTEPMGPLSKSLNEFKMIGNKLNKFPPTTLSGMENLTTVHLEGNELTTEAITGAFKGLKSLIFLDVSNNKLKKLPAGVPNSLEMLYADHNDIDSIPGAYLQKLPALQYLRVSHNKLADSGVPAGVFNSSSLIELDLSFNKLQSIPEVNENLEHLYLQGNSINKFDLTSFCKFTGPLNYSRLRHLRLDGNNVTRENMPFDTSNCLRQATDIVFE